VLDRLGALAVAASWPGVVGRGRPDRAVEAVVDAAAEVGGLAVVGQDDRVADVLGEMSRSP
jgi:hypothetical protein